VDAERAEDRRDDAVEEEGVVVADRPGFGIEIERLRPGRRGAPAESLQREVGVEDFDGGAVRGLISYSGSRVAHGMVQASIGYNDAASNNLRAPGFKSAAFEMQRANGRARAQHASAVGPQPLLTRSRGVRFQDICCSLRSAESRARACPPRQRSAPLNRTPRPG
jgi:hypothetical protein